MAHIDSELPRIEVTLSRSAYRLGGTIVGTIRVTDVDTKLQRNPRQLLQSLTLVISGKCRLDSRWHSVPEYKQVYGLHPSLLDCPNESSTVCFWATHPLELLDLQERDYGSWQEQMPKPVHLPDWPLPKAMVAEYEQLHGKARQTKFEERQLTFTFRADIPASLPHSLSARSCRVFYSALLRIQLRGSSEPHWRFHPLTVLTISPKNKSNQLGNDKDSFSNNFASNENSPRRLSIAGSGRVKLGTVHAMAHSSGLPVHVTVNELQQPKGRISVHTQGSTMYRNVQTAAMQQNRKDDSLVQTMRISNQEGKLVCVLTLVGVYTGLSPGGRALLNFEFPQDRENNDNWIPCHQVCACLDGQEIAINKDGTRKKAQTFLFATDYQRIDPLCVDSISLELLLPHDAPCTVSAFDLVEVSIRCQIDIAISDSPDAESPFQYLHLEIPCLVLHSIQPVETKYNDDNDDNDTDEVPKWNPIVHSDYPATDPRSFRTDDIEDELVDLSVRLANQSGMWDAQEDKYIA